MAATARNVAGSGPRLKLSVERGAIAALLAVLLAWFIPVHAQPARLSGPSVPNGPPVVFYPPLGLDGLHTLEDGRAVGLYPDLLAALAKAAKWSPQIRSRPWPEPLDAVRGDQGDVLGPVMGQPSVFNDLLHTVPLMRVEWARYVRVGESRSRNGIVFPGVRVAVIGDSFGTRWLTREHPLAVQVPVPSIQAGLQALIDGQADALLSLKIPSRTLIQRHWQDRVEEVGTELTAPMTLALSPRSAALLPELDKAIETLTASGEIDRLRSRWMPEAPRTASELAERRLTMMLGTAVALLSVLLVVLVGVNRRLAKARRSAEEARQAKSDFLAIMSHEIRTPINGLVNLIDLLQRTRVNGEQATLLRQAEQANRALLGLVNQVLDFSKIEAERMEIRPHPMALETLMVRVQAVLGAQARAPAVALEFMSLPDGLPVLMADEQRLAQVLINLGGNALKFTESGTVRLLVLERKPASGDGRMRSLRFEVQDTGPGIPADQIQRLFQPFVQLKTGLDRPHAGTGLGLSTSARLVQQMGGELQVSSEPGRLTRFWFDLDLPQAPTIAAAAPEVDAGRSPVADGFADDAHARPAAVDEAKLLPQRRVMVVDDNPLNLLVTRKILEQEGFAVLQAEDAQVAMAQLQAASSELPDLILMDLHMPGVDGVEAVRQMRASLGDRLPPVMALSGAVTEDAREAALAAGMVGFLHKPFDRASLLAAIRAQFRTPLQKA